MMDHDEKNRLDKAMAGMGCFDTIGLVFCNTEEFLEMAADSEDNKRNRSVYVKKVKRSIDPEGTHIQVFSMLHNDLEIRSLWFVKMRGKIEPTRLWLDVDITVYGRCTHDKEVPTPEVKELHDETS